MTTTEFLGVLGIWFIFAAVAAGVGIDKKIGYGWAFAICFLTGPIIGLVICLLTPDKLPSRNT